ncbi:MAG: DUF3253 domain-containing protein [Caldimonas sp.]
MATTMAKSMNGAAAPVKPAEIAAAIQSLVGARAAPATACPSEVARRLAGDDGPWRALMPAVREAAAALARDGRISVTRGGVEVDAVAPGGPIRLGHPIAAS